MVHHIVMWKFKPEVEDAKKPELKKAMADTTWMTHLTLKF